MNNENDPKDINFLLIKLNEKIDLLTEKVNNDNAILLKHINFIESIYEIIKTPLHYIMDTANIFLINNKPYGLLE